MPAGELVDQVHAVTAWVAATYVELPTARYGSDFLTRTVQFNEAGLPGAKTIPAISGPNGAGKSTLCHQWAANYYREQVAPFRRDGGVHRWEPTPGLTADVAPVVWVNLQANAQVAEVDVQILQFLGLGLSGVVRELSTRAVKAMIRHRVRVLLIDDVHLLNLTRNGGRDVLDHLKHLNTELGEHGGSLVLVGANLHTTSLVTDTQIAARLRVYQLKPINLDSREERERWSAVVRAAEPGLTPVLPAARTGFLDQHAQLLHDLSGGDPGHLITVLKEAAINAIITRYGTITDEILEASTVHDWRTGIRA
nr:TniB family NTP-binding protein [Yimella sp. cx-51]